MEMSRGVSLLRTAHSFLTGRSITGYLLFNLILHHTNSWNCVSSSKFVAHKVFKVYIIIPLPVCKSELNMLYPDMLYGSDVIPSSLFFVSLPSMEQNQVLTVEYEFLALVIFPM